MARRDVDVKKRPKARPLLMAAFFCENLLTEKDEVLSAIRIVDRFTLAPVPERSTPEGMAFFTNILIAFKAGQAKGRRKLKITSRNPSGKPGKKVLELPLVFEGGARGVNCRIKAGIIPEEGEGIYWYDVYLNDEFITSMPLEVVYLKQLSHEEAGEHDGEASRG